MLEVVSEMLVVLGLASLFVVISIVWPIVAIAKENSERTEYTFTACVAGWYAQIMAIVGIVVFTAGIGYFLISPTGNQLNVPLGEILGFALAFTGAFVAHMWIWRSFPGGTWWSSAFAASTCH